MSYWPLNPTAAALIGRSHNVAARILASVAGSQFVIPVPIVEDTGSVKVDGGSQVRRTLDVQVYGVLDDPAMDPYLAEWRAEYGLVEPNGTVWWVPVGVFVLDSVVEAGSGKLAVKGSDRWRRVSDARFEQPAVTSGNTATAMKALMEAADGRILVSTVGAPSGTHLSSVWDRDRDKAVADLGRSIGAVAYFQADGAGVVQAIPSLGDLSRWQVGRGLGGAKSSSRRGRNVDRTYNAVVVTGKPQDAAPVYGVARDTAVDSPTRYGGPFGKRPRFYTSSLVTTQAQADAAAARLLGGALGKATTLDLEAAPNPALDAGDVITAEVEPGRWERHIVESFTLPLGLGPVSIATRSTAGDDDGE